MTHSIKKYKFITADDHDIVAKSLVYMLKDLYKDCEVFQVDKVNQIIQILQKETIDLLILDISFPEGDTLGIIPKLREIQPNLKILIFSGHDENIYAMRYFHANINGYVSKLINLNEVKNAILEVMNNRKSFSKVIQEQILDNSILKKPSNTLQQLSNREFEIAKLFVKGYGNTEICQELDLQKSTVSTYKNRIFEKLEVGNVAELINLFNLYHEEG